LKRLSYLFYFKAEILNLEKVYFERQRKYFNELSRIKKWYKIISFLRLITFIAGILLGVSMFGKYPGLTSLIVFGSIVLFFILIRKHGLLSQKISHLEALIKLNKTEIQVLNDDFSELEDGTEFLEPAHSYSFDLDLFGQGSLFQYINRTCSQSGWENLAGWLTNPFKKKEKIVFQQEAVIELNSSSTLQKYNY